MSVTIHLHVGSVEEMGQRFVSAWRRLERGEAVAETHLTFFSLETMMATLSPERLALLRQVRQHPIHTVAELARALSRDDRQIYEDVAALARAGLIVRDEHGIRTPYSHVQATVSLES